MNFNDDIRDLFTKAENLLTSSSKGFQWLKSIYQDNKNSFGKNGLIAFQLGVGFVWVLMIAVTIIIPVVYLAVMIPTTIIKHTALSAFSMLSKGCQMIANGLTNGLSMMAESLKTMAIGFINLFRKSAPQKPTANSHKMKTNNSNPSDVYREGFSPRLTTQYDKSQQHSNEKVVDSKLPMPTIKYNNGDAKSSFRL